MDDIDRRLLSLLELDGRASFRELADSVALSANAVAERVRKLHTSGVISGIHAHVDPAATGRGMRAYLDVFLAPGVHSEVFERAALALDGVLEIAHVTGRADYLMAVAVRDAADLDRLLGELKAGGSIAATESRIVLRRATGPAGRSALTPWTSGRVDGVRARDPCDVVGVSRATRLRGPGARRDGAGNRWPNVHF